MRKYLIALGVSLLLRSLPASAQSTDEKIQALEKRVEELELRLKEKDPPARPVEVPSAGGSLQAGSGASVGAGPGGFTIKSNDGNYSLKIGADLQVDSRTFNGGGSSSLTDQFLLRRVRPTFSGTVYRYVDYYLRPDFGQGTTIIYDAYVQLNYFPRAQLRVGKFKPPVGLERLQSDDDTNFVERGLPTLLVPSRDIGFQLSGDIVKRRIGYQAGVFNGVPDNGLSDASPSNHRDYAGRIFMTPFQSGGESPLSGLGFGVGASGGSVDNVALPGYKTVGQNTFMNFATGVTAAGHRTRLAPQAYYYVGPLGVFAEYGLTEEGLQKGAVRRDVAFRAWQVQATYILTGEKKGFTAPTPRRSFDPLNHGWGALEVAVRVGDFRAEPGLFNYGFADPAKSPRQAHEWVGGLNWYLNRLVRLSLDYGNTNFGGGAAAGNRPPEHVVLARFQINTI
jgi:phosphate-selective porin OprO and OprP